MMMALIWVIWFERNNRILSQKSKISIELLDSILYFGQVIVQAHQKEG